MIQAMIQEEERAMQPTDNYPLAPTSQRLVLIAASPGDPVAEALAYGLRQYGWTPVVTDQVEAHAAGAQACIVPLAPASLSSPAVIAALNARPANLIPLVMAPMSPPYAPWAVAPIPSSGFAEHDSAAIHRALVGLLGPAAPAPSMPPQVTAPYPSMYGAQPTYPMGYPGPQGHAGYGAGGVDPQTQSAPPKRRSSLPLIFTGIGALALVVLVLGGWYAYHVTRIPAAVTSAKATATAPTPAPTPTATLPPGFSLYADPAGDYRVDQPTSWTRSVSNGDAVWVSGEQGGDIVIGHVSGTATNDEIVSTESSTFKEISLSAGGNGSYDHLEGPTSIPLAGETWTQEAADMTIHGVVLHTVVIIANHNGSAYIIAYAGLKNDFSSLDSHTFYPMLLSFTFLD